MFATLSKLFNKARRSTLVNNVAVLASGTALAQGITVLASPVLTRLYSPEAFGLFATFMAFVSTFTPAVTGRFEVALMLPPAERAARELFAVSVWFCVAFCGVLLAVTWILLPNIVVWFKVPELGGWLFIAPVTLLFAGLSNLTRYAANRRNQYACIARSGIAQAVTIAGINIGLGVAGAHFAGLIIGNIVGFGVSLVYLVITQRDFIREVNFKWSARKNALARRYKDFPIYNASTGFLSGVTVNLPVFFMIAYFPPEAVGFYALVIRVMSAPTTIISSAVSQVNLKKVVELVAHNIPVDRYLMQISAALLAIALPPTIIFVFWGPQIFSFVFGEDWILAGKYSQVLAIALAIKFVSSTISSTLGATNNNRYGALWRIVAFCSTFTVLGLTARYGSIDDFILAIVLNEIGIYLLYFYLILLAARNPRN